MVTTSTATVSTATSPDAEPVVDLRNPALAALLAWLVPGAGHLYQRRTGKGILFMVCILGTFFYGLYLGDGKVVYASWRPNDTRWAYFCQIGAGLPALPALVQAERARAGRAPLFNLDFMCPPETQAQWHREGAEKKLRPANPGEDLQKYDSPDELAWWSKHLHRYFELGTVYTMIAGLLNILAIYDAFAGPVPAEQLQEDEEDTKSPREQPQPA